MEVRNGIKADLDVYAIKVNRVKTSSQFDWAEKNMQAPLKNAGKAAHKDFRLPVLEA